MAFHHVAHGQMLCEPWHRVGCWSTEGCQRTGRSMLRAGRGGIIGYAAIVLGHRALFGLGRGRNQADHCAREWLKLKQEEC